MTTNQVAASQQRERIPTNYLLQFDGLTNAELASMSRDELCPEKWRSFCLWEMEYREVMGVELYYDADADAIKRKRV